eukprot:1923556-Prymnesium_polylepis.2
MPSERVGGFRIELQIAGQETGFDVVQARQKHYRVDLPPCGAQPVDQPLEVGQMLRAQRRHVGSDGAQRCPRDFQAESLRDERCAGARHHRSGRTSLLAAAHARHGRVTEKDNVRLASGLLVRHSGGLPGRCRLNSGRRARRRRRQLEGEADVGDLADPQAEHAGGPSVGGAAEHARRRVAAGDRCCTL